MKKFFLITVCIIFLLFIILLNSTDNYDSSSTNMNESNYNDMKPSEYHKEMKSENLKYSDVAWQAQNTYGWNCSEITDMSNPIATSGKELNDQYLISQIKGNYSIASCSSGIKLRVYPRYNTYPIITNINGGFD